MNCPECGRPVKTVSQGTFCFYCEIKFEDLEAKKAVLADIKTRNFSKERLEWIISETMIEGGFTAEDCSRMFDDWEMIMELKEGGGDGQEES